MRRSASASPSHTARVRSAGISRAADTDPGVVVDPGQRLGVAARSPAGTRRPHPSATTPSEPTAPTASTSATACRRRAGLDHPRPQQRPIRRRRRRQQATPPPRQLVHQPPRPPVRPRTPQLQQRGLDLGRHLMRTRPRPMRPVHQPFQTLSLIPRPPGMHRLPRHPGLLRSLRHTQPVGDHRQHGLIPLLSHAHLPHGIERQGSTGATVKHQPKQCHPSTEAKTSNISRSHTQR